MRVTFATFRTALADGWANRGSFILQVLIMVANDITWVIFWALFFNRTGTVRGWTFADLAVLFALQLTGGGISLGLFANVRRIGRFAAEGAFDEALVLPVSTLGYTLARRVDPSNFGDLLFGPALFLVAGHPTPARLVVFVAGACVGAVVLMSFLVLCGALTFFIGGNGEQAELGFNAVIIFASYPIAFFRGLTRILLFTVVPAAFVTGLPAQLVQHFDPGTALLLLAFAVGLAAAAMAVFALGLRRYSSGSVWVR